MNKTKDLQEYLQGTRSRDTNMIPLVKKKVPNNSFGTNLKLGQVYEDVIIDNLLEVEGIDEVETNDDFKFDLQFKIKSEDDTKVLRIESKFHDPKYGNICLVVHENDKWKQWFFTSELYCGSYYEDGNLYNSYFRIEDFITLIKEKDSVLGKRLDSFSKTNYNWKNEPYYSFLIPTKIFREEFSTFSMIVD